MPSLLHEALLLLFRNRPSLAAELMREALGEKLPPHDTAEVQEADLSQIVPTEYHADLVVLLRSNEPVFGIVVEVQLQRDDDKRYSWPLYATALRAKLRCPACVLVVCADQSVARWAQRPIHTGQPNAEGRAEGQAEGLVQALLRILASRGLQLGPQQEHTVRDCSDPALLEQWIDRALNADSVEQALRDT